MIGESAKPINADHPGCFGSGGVRVVKWQRTHLNRSCHWSEEWDQCVSVGTSFRFTSWIPQYLNRSVSVPGQLGKYGQEKKDTLQTVPLRLIPPVPSCRIPSGIRNSFPPISVTRTCLQLQQSKKTKFGCERLNSQTWFTRENRLKTKKDTNDSNLWNCC